MKQHPCCFKRFLLAPVSIIAVHRVLGCFCLQYVQLTDFSADCITKVDAVEGADLLLIVRPKFDFTGVMAGSDCKFLPISLQRSLAPTSLSNALNSTKEYKGYGNGKMVKND